MAVKPFMQSWLVSKHEFPKEGTPAEKLTFFARYAILAPSPYNTQPWMFDIKGDTISVYADRRHALPVTDPDDRGLIIAVSAAFYNLKLAIRCFGYEEETTYLPDRNTESLIAQVKLGDYIGESLASDIDRKRFDEITAFEYSHGKLVDKPVSEEDLEALKEAVISEDAWLYVCDETDKNNILNLTIEADQIQFANKNFRREYAIWTDKRRANSGDGHVAHAKPFSEAMNTFTPTLLRRFAGEDGQVADAVAMKKDVPLLVIIGAVKGGAQERVMTGQALMKLCLTAASHGLCVTPLNQICEVPELRLRLHDEINQQGRAHLLLRIGYGGKPHLCPRRNLSSMLTIDGKPFDEEKMVSKSTDTSKQRIFSRITSFFLAKRS